MEKTDCHNCREFGDKVISSIIKLKEIQIEKLSEDFNNINSKDEKTILEGRIMQCNLDLKLFQNTKQICEIIY